MSMQSEGKDAKGRNYDQVTDGSTSIATMGAGSTGEVGASAERKDPVPHQQAGSPQSGSQQAGRTDDLLAGGSGNEQADRGFQGQAGQQGGQAAGNSQSGQGGAQSSSQSSSQSRSQSSAQGKDLKGAAETDDDQYDQGTARREGQP